MARYPKKATYIFNPYAPPWGVAYKIFIAFNCCGIFNPYAPPWGVAVKVNRNNSPDRQNINNSSN
jgi:hypothetical protein